MSEASNTYACEICTFVQSIKRPACEMCGTPNPNFNDETFGFDEAIANAMSQSEDQVIECPKCHYIHIGTTIQICNGCRTNIPEMSNPHKRLRMEDIFRFLQFPPHGIESEQDDNDDDDDNNNDDDDDDVIVMPNVEQPKAKDTQEKKAEAVEKPMENTELHPYYNRYILLMKDLKDHKKSFTEEQLREYLTDLFNSLQYKNDQTGGQLTFSNCQICLGNDEPLITMKSCGHRVICTSDFNRYLTVRINDGDILPWIPCPAESCFIPCHADNITNDGKLSYFDLLTFITTYMLKKLCRNENFITCIHCEKGGFLEFGPPVKHEVTCPLCSQRQTIEKGADGDLDISFKKMIQTGQLRECPTCRHLTLKEKGLCNIIECAKCGVWWNWRTREQGHNEKDMKQRARINGTLWEPGELRYQQDLERNNPTAFRALLERNGIKYNPNYVRGGWEE